MVKKISKKFHSFEEEENWLAQIAQEGWRLVSYDDTDVEASVYKFEEDPHASEYHYQIDYRNFNKKSEYEEYKTLFEEADWTFLSKSYFYNKHIFISKSKSSIFSDATSRLERDINRYRNAKIYMTLFIIQAIITAGLYYYFELKYSYLGAITIFGIGAAIYNFIDAFKRNKKIHQVRLGE